MAYTTNADIKRGLPSQYWKASSKKLEEDGYKGVGLDLTSAEEDTFLGVFRDQAADYIDGVLGNGPYTTTGLLERINRIFAIYDVELYIISATSDRVISITLSEQRKEAEKILMKMLDGTIDIAPLGDNTANQPALIEPTNDGVTLNHGDLEDAFFAGDADATEIPE